MAKITPASISVTRAYAVATVDPVPDSSGCPLDPEEATVKFSDYDGTLRARWIGISGRRMRGEKTKGTYNRAGYGIDSAGKVEPDDRRGLPPAWVQEVVRQAIEDQAAARGLPTPASSATRGTPGPEGKR